ncbi:uncharacterized protein METZ01_LOCUS194175 [marine metagenome]|uniref:Uncharacterized protein n=1 Tax=marine metagenome TaxID=408172 RepID=A0A382DUB2_9ZZZZ
MPQPVSGEICIDGVVITGGEMSEMEVCGQPVISSVIRPFEPY